MARASYLFSVLVLLIKAKAISEMNGEKDPIYTWADRLGIDCSKVEVRQFSKGDVSVRGLGATRSIAAGEHILEIPERFALLSDRTPSVPACQPLWSQIEDAHHRQIVTVLLEQSRGDESPWFEYLKALPSLADFASFYPYAAGGEVFDDFRALKVVGAHIFWHSATKELRETVRHFMEQTDGGSACFATLPSSDDFLWAECVVSTRQYDEGGMVPLADYANCPNEKDEESSAVMLNTESSWMELQTGTENVTYFVIKATRDIAKGEELLQPYGQVNPQEGSTHDFILDTWGFLAVAGWDAVEVLSPEVCSRLQPSINKYLLPSGSCDATAAACNLARLSTLHCQGIATQSGQDL